MFLCFSPITRLSSPIKPWVRRPQRAAERPGSSGLNGPVSAEWKCTVFSVHLVWVSAVRAPLDHHHNHNRQLHSGCHTNLQSIFISLPLLSHLCATVLYFQLLGLKNSVMDSFIVLMLRILHYQNDVSTNLMVIPFWTMCVSSPWLFHFLITNGAGWCLFRPRRSSSARNLS